MVVVSKDSPSELAALNRDEGFEFPLLSDSRLELARELGVIQPGADFHRGGDLARPAVLFFDREGALRRKLLTENWRQRIHGDDVVAELRAMEPQ